MVALHNYLLDDDGKIFARLTTYADDEEEAVDLMDELDFEEANDSFEVLEDPVTAPDAAALRTVSESQAREFPEGEDEEEGEDAEDLEEEEEVER